MKMGIGDFLRKIGILRTGGEVVQEDINQGQTDNPADSAGKSQPDFQDSESFDDSSTE